MADLAQAGFEIGEDIADALHNLDGCEKLLLEQLDEPLAALPDKGHSVLTLISAMQGFRSDVDGRAQMLIRMCSGN